MQSMATISPYERSAVEARIQDLQAQAADVAKNREHIVRLADQKVEADS